MEGDNRSDRATGVAALAGALIVFLAGRRRSSRSTTAPVKETASTSAKQTTLWKLIHWLKGPAWKEVREKGRLEEHPPKIPEPPKVTGKKPRIRCVTFTCGETTDGEAEDAKKPEKKEEDPNSLTSIVLAVLGAIATGIGVAGAVTVVGAAIFWARFDALGLPATQAVSAIPKAELLVQGAQEVTIFILIGLTAALLIALADPKGLVSHGTVFVLCLLVIAATVYTMTQNLHLGWVLGLVGLALVLALLCIGIAFTTGQRLLPLLVSVFLASLIFSSSCALVIVEQQEYAQAIAIRFGRDNGGIDKELTGIYVAATDSTIFYARIGTFLDNKMTVDATGLYEVHRADTTTYAVGPMEPTEGPGNTDPVEERAKELLKSLNQDGESFVSGSA